MNEKESKAKQSMSIETMNIPVLYKGIYYERKEEGEVLIKC